MITWQYLHGYILGMLSCSVALYLGHTILSYMDNHQNQYSFMMYFGPVLIMVGIEYVLFLIIDFIRKRRIK